MQTEYPAPACRTHNIVILIHGTWPGKKTSDGKPRATWCQESSLCREAVRAAFGKDVVIKVFPWPGKNSPDDRSRAADKLNAFLGKLRRDNPPARIYLIAHSHGGNVVLYAAQRATESSSIHGAVFLSTPFLVITPRVLGPSLAKTVELTAGLAIICLMLIAYMRWGSASSWNPYTLYQAASSNWWAYLKFVFIASSCGLLARFGLVPCFRAFHRWNHAYAQSLTLPNELPFPVLIIRGTGDEAAGVLGTTAFLSQLATRVLHASLKLIPGESTRATTESSDRPRYRWRSLPSFVKVGLLICATACVLLGALVGFKAIGILPNSEWTLLAALTLLLFVIGALIIAWEAVAQFLVIPLFLSLNTLSAIVSCLFGLRFGLATFGLDISTEATPPGRWTSFQLEASSEPYENRRGLIQVHATHSNPDALAEMTRWFRQLNEL